MQLNRLTRGLPYSAVFALLGWLMLSQGPIPNGAAVPRSAALTHTDSSTLNRCASAADRQSHLGMEKGGDTAADPEHDTSLDCDTAIGP